MSLQYCIWLASGIAALWLWVWLLNYASWWSLGYRRFRGTWYNPYQYSELMTMLEEDRQAGARAMHQDEIRALNAWQNGRAFG